jgi:hypothetical protein
MSDGFSVRHLVIRAAHNKTPFVRPRRTEIEQRIKESSPPNRFETKIPCPAQTHDIECISEAISYFQGERTSDAGDQNTQSQA